MSELFDRKYTFSVTPAREGLGLDFFSLGTIKDLNIKFKIKKYGSEKANTAIFEIINLSKKAREDLSVKDTGIVFEAGYLDSLGLAYKGKVIVVDSQKSDTEWITKFEAKDGADKTRNVVISESFKAGTSEFDALNKIIKLSGIDKGLVKLVKDANLIGALFSDEQAAEFGIPKDLKTKDLKSHTFNKGTAFSGTFNYILTTVCNSNGLYWFINDERLNVLPVGTGLPGDEILIKSGGLLKGSPQKINTGYKIKSVLQAGYNPGVRVKLKSREVEGSFIIKNVEHIGELESQNTWDSILEVFEA